MITIIINSADTEGAQYDTMGFTNRYGWSYLDKSPKTLVAKVIYEGQGRHMMLYRDSNWWYLQYEKEPKEVYILGRANIVPVYKGRKLGLPKRLAVR